MPLLFGTQFENFVVLGVGMIDSSRFKGVEELENLRQHTEEGLKNYVALLTPDNTVTFREVDLLDNDGETVRLAPGDLKPGDRLAQDLGDSVPEGQRVQPLGEPAA